MQIYKFGFIFLITISVSQSANYLTEKPDFLRPCSIHGKQDPQCFNDAVQNLFTNWKAGSSGLTNLGSIDPFKLKKLRLRERIAGVIDIQLELRNVLVYGIAGTKVSQATINEKDYSIHMELYLPVFKLMSDYKLKGRVLLLNLDGQGQMQIDLTDISFSVMAKTNLVKRGEEFFIDVQSISTVVKNIGNLKIHFTNLFNGNQELENSAHEIFNGNWRTLFEALRPGITRTWDAILLDRCKRVFSFIPARYFISDLP